MWWVQQEEYTTISFKHTLQLGTSPNNRFMSLWNVAGAFRIQKGSSVLEKIIRGDRFQKLLMWEGPARILATSLLGYVGLAAPILSTQSSIQGNANESATVTALTSALAFLASSPANYFSSSLGSSLRMITVSFATKERPKNVGPHIFFHLHPKLAETNGYLTRRSVYSWCKHSMLILTGYAVRCNVSLGETLLENPVWVVLVSTGWYWPHNLLTDVSCSAFLPWLPSSSPNIFVEE